MESITSQIRNESVLKKSAIIAEAIAAELTDLTGTKAEALLGSKGRKSRRTGESSPSYFIRTTVYKCAWATYLSKKEAEQVQAIASKSIDQYRDPSYSAITEKVREMGVLEVLKMVESRKTTFPHLEKAVHELRGAILATKIGI